MTFISSQHILLQSVLSQTYGEVFCLNWDSNLGCATWRVSHLYSTRALGNLNTQFTVNHAEFTTLLMYSSLILYTLTTLNVFQ